MLEEQLTELPEVIFEPTRGDDLDDASWFAAGVPHGVHLPARFGDVATGPRTTSLSSERDPISPVSTIECSSSRVCRCAAVSTPTSMGCSTMEPRPRWLCWRA